MGQSLPSALVFLYYGNSNIPILKAEHNKVVNLNSVHVGFVVQDKNRISA